MSGERLALVKSFGELREGMIVVVKPCAWCGTSHRAMLIRLEPNHTGITPVGRIETGDAWRSACKVACGAGRDGERSLLITAKAVSRGALFRVLDGLETESSTTTEAVRPPETVR